MKPILVKDLIKQLEHCDPNKQVDADIMFDGRKDWVGFVAGVEDGPHLTAVILIVKAGQESI